MLQKYPALPGEQGDMSGILMLYLLRGKLQQLDLSLSWIVLSGTL